MLDTALIYQNQTPDGVTHFNESLVGRALKKFGRENFGLSFDAFTVPRLLY
jgi:aryl-alcohol dehydrogenase-like predicted oxidoreductase